MKLPEPGDAGSAAPADTPPPAPSEPAPSEPAPAEPAGSDSDSALGGDTGSASATDERPRAKIVMDESSMTMLPPVLTVPSDFGAKVVAHWAFDLRLAGKIKAPERGRLLILYLLIGTGLLLVIGLAVNQAILLVDGILTRQAGTPLGHSAVRAHAIVAAWQGGAGMRCPRFVRS